MDIILYEDSAVSALHPITLTRPASEIRTGGYTLVEAVKYVFPNARLVSLGQSNEKAKGTLFLNARFAPSLAVLQTVAGILGRSTEDCAFLAEGNVCGMFTAKQYSELPDASAFSIQHDTQAKLFAHPEDIIFFNKDTLKENLEIAAKKLRAKRKGLYVDRSVLLPEQFAYNTQHDPSSSERT